MAKPVDNRVIFYRKSMNTGAVRLMLKLLGCLVLSWIMIHFFALLGVFFLITYPIWVLLSPEKETCLFCIIGGRHNTGCIVCKKSELERRGVAGRILLNVLLIIFLTAASIGIVYGEKLLLERAGLFESRKTVEMSIPTENEYKIGELFTLPIEVSGIAVPINTVQVDIKYPPELLEVVEFLTADSFAEIFVQKEVRNDLGLARISGGLPNPGYSKEEGLFGKVLFRAKTAGLGEIQILPTSLVLANDGSSTNVLAEFKSSAIRVLDEKISKDEEEFQKSFLNTSVLGVTSGKLEFFEEEIMLTESILQNNEIQKNKANWGNVLYSIDSKILDVLLLKF